jgi:hypothetical protein
MMPTSFQYHFLTFQRNGALKTLERQKAVMKCGRLHEDAVSFACVTRECACVSVLA